MNIFFVHRDPSIAARYLVNQHCNKMVVESCQMLANCYSKERLAESDCPRTSGGNPRKYSYFNHPCSIWVRNSIKNWKWLIDHVFALESERLYRKFNPHFSVPFMQWCSDNPPDLPNIAMTEPALAMDDFVKHSDPVIAYRQYYNVCKREQDTLKKNWGSRGKPNWWLNDLDYISLKQKLING